MNPSNKLFEKDKSRELENLENEIKSDIIKSYHEGKGKKPVSLQKKLNTLTNFKSYEDIRQSKKDENGGLNFKIKECINSRFNRFKKIMDVPEEKFLESFPGNFMQRIFELAMADFISKRFDLKERKPLLSNSEDTVDFKFSYNGKLYFMECTTRNSSLLDKFFELLFQLDPYLEVAKIFREKLNECEKEWHYMTQPVWNNYLTQEEKGRIIEKLSLNPTDRDLAIKIDERVYLALIDEWVYLALYVMQDFSYILPEEILEKLKEVFPNPNLSRSEDGVKLSRFLIDSLALKIIEKLKKPYFEEGTPVIISISLSTLPYGLFTHSFFKNNLIEKLPETINNVIERDKLDSNTIKDNMKNLYAIIIDTTWYNWHPDIMEKFGSANFPGEIKNCYQIIYNKNISPNMSEKFIFNGMVTEENYLEMNFF